MFVLQLIDAASGPVIDKINITAVFWQSQLILTQGCTGKYLVIPCKKTKPNAVH